MEIEEHGRHEGRRTTAQVESSGVKLYRDVNVNAFHHQHGYQKHQPRITYLQWNAFPCF